MAENESGTYNVDYIDKNYDVEVTRQQIANQLKAQHVFTYTGVLSSTQYMKDIRTIITWSPILTTGISLNKSSLTLEPSNTSQLTYGTTPASVSYSRRVLGYY